MRGGQEIKEFAWLASRIARKAPVAAIPIPFHFGIARIRGRLMTDLRGVPDAVVRNLEDAREALGGTPIERIAKGHCEFAEAGYLWRMLPNLPGFRRSRRWPVTGIEHVTAALSHGRGVILLTAHMGYPHFIPRILELHGLRVRQVVAELDRLEKKESREAWRKHAGRWREALYRMGRLYTESIGPEDMIASLDVRPIISALAKNEILLLAGDGLRATDFRLLPVLGNDYPIPSGFVKLALATGATVLPAFSIPEGSRIQTTIHPPLPIDSEASIEENLRGYADVLNAHLTRTPHLWLRWRRPNWFQEARDWIVEAKADPFGTKLVNPSRSVEVL
jgi:lauroyl/myristoyl acyltransferase